MSNTDSPNDIFQLQFTKIKLIGHGGFGEAWTVRSKTTKNLFLMKTLPYDNIENNAVQLEVHILKCCNHENIVRYIDHFNGKRNLHIVMEFCSGGDLSQVIKQRQKIGEQFSEDIVLKWSWQLTNGLKYMKKKGILHRDLKPANIFLTGSGVLKIGDFGVSRWLDQGRGTADTVCGSPSYMAPEVTRGERYDHRADLWSLGCVLYELCGLEKAFSGSLAHVMEAVTRGHFKPLPPGQHPLVSSIVPQLLSLHPEHRPSAEQILRKLR